MVVAQTASPGLVFAAACTALGSSGAEGFRLLACAQ
jgi:hypothetical protein